MFDQAATLRELAKKRPMAMTFADPNCQLLAVTSGKGGVGKTNVVVNLAIAFRRLGQRVAILDADFGLANVDVVLGLAPQFHLGHVIQGGQTLKSIIVEGPEGIHIIPASSGIQELTEMSERKRDRIVNELSAVLGSYDFLLIDTAAGISNNVIRFLEVARRVIVVLSPEPTAIVDAYALIKVLLKRDSEKEIQLLVNRAEDEDEAGQVHRQLSNVAERFLGQTVGYLGSIPQDNRVVECVRLQQPLLVSYPRIAISRRFRKIAQSLLEQPPVRTELRSLWKEGS